ncbi:hypothetical protein MMC30_009200 [Trapelia coarctata]|nr:hypothetical protein [Trapelia coarctata]
MPLPPHPLTLHGGCSCLAIRYRISIPPLAQRPPHPSNPSLHYPLLLIDHCNDCRLATGALLPFWISTPAAYVSARLLQRSVNAGLKGSGGGPSPLSPSSGPGVGRSGSVKRAEPGARSRAPSLVPRTPSAVSIPAFPFPAIPTADPDRPIPTALLAPGTPAVGDSEAAYGPYLPASEVFTNGPASRDSFLAFYRSSGGVLRTFCGRCGTGLSRGWWGGGNSGEGGEVLSLLVGTVDRGDLEAGWLEGGDGGLGEGGDEGADLEAGAGRGGRFDGLGDGDGDGEGRGWRYNLEPDMHLWWGRGIKWVKRIVGEGTAGTVRYVGGDVGDVDGGEGLAGGEVVGWEEGNLVGCDEGDSGFVDGLKEMEIEDEIVVEDEGESRGVREVGNEAEGANRAMKGFDDMLELIRQGG